MIVLVTGGRNYDRRDIVFAALNDICTSRKRIIGLIHGCASGADSLGKEWQAARITREIAVCTERRRQTKRADRLPAVQYHPELWMVGCPARWGDLITPPVILRHRRDGTPYNAAAGGIRNAFMLTWHPDLVVAFSGGRGTANMCGLADRAGIDILSIK